MHTNTHAHTLWLSALAAVEGSQTLPAQKSTEYVPEGVAPHLGALFHPHFPLGLACTGLADLSALCARVGVAAAGEGAGESLLGRHHLKPVPYRWGTRKTEEKGKRRRKKEGSDEKRETGNASFWVEWNKFRICCFLSKWFQLNSTVAFGTTLIQETGSDTW